MKCYRWELSDGSIWQIPLDVIINNRAAYYHEYHSEEFPTLSLAIDDSAELFASDDYEAGDWARNNMNWEDVKDHAIKIDDGMIDMQEEWVNPSCYRIVES